MKENVAALDVTMTADVVKCIEALVPVGFSLGARYPVEIMEALHR